ncbi:MAG: hypothetical protein H6700_08890 [Myxococcales bacterium]|nr:hypothetical protein [Myxococcales bacterium]MCB9531867.1 hypothetical protein [Myxococcales bacterium]
MQSVHNTTRPSRPLRRRARFDRPDLRPGNQAWWRGTLFRIEQVELQGEQWVAVVSRPSEPADGARCWFAPVTELSYEP